ncbi:hypothetical protein LZZ85_26230 [Terrimonas sp. NA20]|uniref:Intradiol ring-cleavage dioxygenases domain-containing protein n=1 Tax=Terrimonas ginsenosidimutans TaxID=2908004 RepID=A0ABS9KZP9_9BACT|nr:hypothetical protein [Terrimonas ginsenosidimutans]MCG2617826.1 hypothetical protein [Terrimonas ginsenosidimutans]
MNKPSLFSVLFLLVTLAGCTQQTAPKEQKVGGPCEGCEAIFESPQPFDSLKEMVWLSDWDQHHPRRLAVNGVVFDAEGKPAGGVIIYIYHTDTTGSYPKKGNEQGWARRHGHLRGWMKTNEKGEYKFFTLRPGSYPGTNTPAHIHATIKEPGKTAYWIDDFVFDDDPFLTAEERKKCTDRGGTSILKTKIGGSMVKRERNIYLGKNIPNYSLAK